MTASEMPRWLQIAASEQPLAVRRKGVLAEVFTTDQGVRFAEPGDYIICCANGDLHVCSADTFHEKYRRVQ